MDPLVSIIVPVYNALPHLESCIRSLTAQTWANLEILLIDDGSRDESLALCRRCAAADERIRVLHHDNCGPSRTRNRGLDEATGDYIVFSDADDLLEPDAVECMLAAAAQHHAQLVLGAYGRFHNDGESDFSTHRITPYSAALLEGSRDLALLFTEARTSLAGVSIWAKLYDARIIREHGIAFPEEISYEEDCCFNLQYYRHVERAVALRQCVYHYRQVPDSLSKVYRPDTIAQLLNGYHRRCDFLNRIGAAELQPRLNGIMLIVFGNTCKKIALSGMKPGDKRSAYTALAQNEQVRQIVRNAPPTGEKLLRLLAKAIKAGSPLLLSLSMALWSARQKLTGKQR